MTESFVKGMPKLIKRLESLPLNAQRNVARGLVKELAKQTTEQAQAILQGKVSRRTGALSQSIKVKINRGERNKIESASAISDVFYSRFFEFGTSKMTARPFLQPAAEMIYKKIPEIVEPLLSELIEKQFSKLTKRFLSGRR